MFKIIKHPCGSGTTIIMKMLFDKAFEDAYNGPRYDLALF